MEAGPHGRDLAERRHFTEASAPFSASSLEDSEQTTAQRFGTASAQNKEEVDSSRTDFRKRHNMAFPISVLGGLFLLGFGISRVRAKQSRKPNLQTLFSKK